MYAANLAYLKALLFWVYDNTGVSMDYFVTITLPTANKLTFTLARDLDSIDDMVVTIGRKQFSLFRHAHFTKKK